MEGGTPRLTYAMILVNVVVFELVFSMPEALFDQTIGLLSFSSAHIFEAWRLFTSMFLHAGASHLFFNMLGLYFFGRIAEEELGGRRWLLIYFASGVVGSLAYGMTSSLPAVGASGCIFGLMGAAMLLKPKKLIDMYIFPLPLGFIAILYILTQVALSAASVSSVRIAYMAHIGGLLAGVALTLFSRPKDSAKGILMMAGLLVLLIVLFPIIGILVGLGQLALGFIDGIVGLVLYGIAKYGLSWIW